MSGDRKNPLPILRAVTTEVAPEKDLLNFIDPANPLVFQRLDKGLVGIGAAVIGHFSGTNRMTDAAEWWRQLCQMARIENPSSISGTGLVGFGSFTFSADSMVESVLVVPETIVGTDGNQWWKTRIEGPGKTENFEGRVDKQIPAPFGNWVAGSLPKGKFALAIQKALGHIARGDISKVVLARDIKVGLGGPPPWPRVLGHLASEYPNTHIFCVEGLFGASPETLASVRGREIELQVLAGTVPRGATAKTDAAQEYFLATSQKDLEEHRHAVENVVASLRHRGVEVEADEIPSTVKLPNLYHLGTRVVAQLPLGWNSLDIVNTLHPTAAVAGVPTKKALELISSLEPFDRGRYAGPVGWIDDRGDGEWAIALRCGQYSGEDKTVTAFAGAGIVRDSEPEKELLEVSVKLQPIVDVVSKVGASASPEEI